MILFNCDYNEGAHPKIMEALVKTNMEQCVGYSEDEHCENARQLIKKACRNDSLAVHFLVGGTQTNYTVICSALRAHEGVICVDSGHINTHETGSVEATGHKVLAISGKDGKLCAETLDKYIYDNFNDCNFEHIVKAGMVYISNPTEIGTLYSKKEMEDISRVCKKYSLPLFLDGARLGYGLVSPENDLDLPTIAELCDVFYIGETKVGALFGEAVVIRNESIKKDFRYIMKQKGAMLAKGRLLGVQFETLFTDKLYFEISKNAMDCAIQIRDAFRKKGCGFVVESPTNQQFPILENSQLNKLEKKYGFSFWEKIDQTHTAVRFCTSWATTKENVAALCADIENM